MYRTYKIPGKDFGYEEDRVYKVLVRLPHRITSKFSEYQSQDKWNLAQNLLLTEAVVEGPIPDGKGGWMRGKMTDEYLLSDDCDGMEMNILIELILEDSPTLAMDQKKLAEIKKKARKSSD